MGGFQCNLSAKLHLCKQAKKEQVKIYKLLHFSIMCETPFGAKIHNNLVYHPNPAELSIVTIITIVFVIMIFFVIWLLWIPISIAT